MIDTIENDRFRVQVNRLGAELWSVYDKLEQRECLWQGDPAVWPRRAPNLFPVCGSLRGGAALFDGVPRTIPLHGFLRDYDHALAEHSAGRLLYRFTDSEETRAMYPFAFCVETEFVLEESGLRQTFTVTNTGSRELPFSIGYHTGWMCPFDASHSISDYRLVLEREETADRVVNRDLVICGREPYLCGERTIELRDGVLTPNLVLEGLRSRWLRIEEKDTGRFTQIGIGGFPVVVLWSVPEHMPFVCVEPWHGLFEPAEPYGEFSEKPLVRRTAPGEQFSCCMQVCFGRAPL